MKAILGKLALLAAIGAAATVNLSCDVNDYCLNCTRGDAGDDDGGGNDGDIGDGGNGDGDNGDGGCTNTGPEVCDDEDNDCDGHVDEGQLPTIGDPCDNQMGECQGGVKACTNGVVTCSKPAVPEICDLKDNDCNGLTDEGDPGGGAVCGTNTGECVAGVNRCVSGGIQCVGATGPAPGGEICNNRDDDCDGTFDENLVLGPCVAGVDGPSQGSVGECRLGTRECLGGVTTCIGAKFPVFELCDVTALDQDCDGLDHNGYNTNTDPQNCGMCGRVCSLPHAFEGCGPPKGVNGQCTVLACEPNFFDNNNNPADGCEFDCGHAFLGSEVCNGIDDDCDGLVDMADSDLVAPIGLCDADGACATSTVLSCDAGLGWRCHYNGANVQTSDAAHTQILPETICDSDLFTGVMAGQADNDCDGRIDEAQANLGQACSNGLFGDCRNAGAFACNTANRTAAAVCTFTTMGPGMSAEACDGRDNNCNNVVDEGATTGNLPGQDWVTIPGLTPTTQIMKYEASRPDATATAGGTVQSYTCSRTGAQPWANLTYPEAVAACGSINARLCTESEWQSMCEAPTAQPVTGPATTATTDFVFIEAEDYVAKTDLGGHPWTRIAPIDFNGVTAMQVPDTGFAVPAAANALAQSSRLDYQLSLTTGVNYRVWLRMRAPAAIGQPAVFGTHTAPTATLSPTADASTAVGDLVVVTTWTVSNVNPAITHAVNTAGGFVEIRSQAYDEGTVHGRLSVAYKIATAAGAQTYPAYTVTAGTTTTSYSGITVLRAGAYNLTGLLSNSGSDTGSGAPNPANAGAVAGPTVVLAIGAWHTPTNGNISSPTNYTELWELGAGAADLSVATRTITTGDADPGGFGDNITPNGTANMAIGIPLATSGASNSVWVGLTAGTTAGAANATAVTVGGTDQWRWVVSPALTATATGTHTFSIYVRDDGVIVDTIAVAQQSTQAPTFDNIWAYQNTPRTPQPTVCNGDELDTDTVAAGDQDGILATGALPMCFANQASTADAFDMSGNVKEWTAARSAGQNPIRGGASNNLVTGLTCQLNFTLADNDFFFPNVGFRCCR